MVFTYATAPSLAHHLISLATFRERAASTGKHYHKVVVGVAIFRPLTSYVGPQVLIVQRAAHEKVLPNFFELPGGHVEDSDQSILDAVARETLEETGLVVREIVSEIPPFEYSAHKFTADADPAIDNRLTLQLNFVAKMGAFEPSEVKLNPDEHRDHAWITKEDVARYNMTEAMRVVVSNALDWAEKNLASLG